MWRWPWGPAESQGPRASLRNSHVPPRTAWPWPPSSCRPVYSRCPRRPWPPRRPQTAPYSCSSSATGASSALSATPPAPEPQDLAGGAVWPRLSSLRGPVRACALPYPTLGVARDPALCPALPSPLEAGDGGPRTVSEDDAGQGHPVKEGTGGEKAPRTWGFTSQTRHISEGLQAQTHVGLPLLPRVCQLPARGACPPVSSLHSSFCSLGVTFHLLSSTPKSSLAGHVTATPWALRRATSWPCLCFDSSLQLPS